MHRMAKDGVQPNTKTFTALIGSVGKMSTIGQAMDIINELLSHESDPSNLIQTYSALMSACEKAGQWDLAVALFDKMSAQVNSNFAWLTRLLFLDCFIHFAPIPVLLPLMQLPATKLHEQPG